MYTRPSAFYHRPSVREDISMHNRIKQAEQVCIRILNLQILCLGCPFYCLNTTTIVVSVSGLVRRSLNLRLNQAVCHGLGTDTVYRFLNSPWPQRNRKNSYIMKRDTLISFAARKATYVHSVTGSRLYFFLF